MNRPFVLCLGFTLLFVCEARSQSRDLTEMIPTGTMKVDVMNLALPKRQVQLTRKMEAGVRENRDWFEAYMVENAKTRPLPYHENFGLSRMEYKELAAFTPGDGRFKKVAVEEIDVRRGKGSTCSIHGVGLLSNVPVVSIDQDKETVKFPEFPVAKAQRIQKFAEGGPVGPMEGQRWLATSIKKAGGDGAVRSLALIKPLKENFLYFDFVHQVFKDSRPVVNDRLIFRVRIED
jgi:hypothetical protein